MDEKVEIIKRVETHACNLPTAEELAVEGLTYGTQGRCPVCGQVYTWMSGDQREPDPFWQKETMR